jgi:hypothetical protein
MRGPDFQESQSGFFSALVSLFASSGTLVCCAIPALLVSIGAGSALASLVSAYPQIVWLSEHKEIIFAVSAISIAIGGFQTLSNRHAPCPADPELRRACLTLRKTSSRMYMVSLALFVIGGWFVFIQPLI